MDLSLVVTNAVDLSSIAVRPAALTIDFSAHQAPTLHPHRTLARASPPRVAVLSAPSSPGRVPTTHATWLSTPTAHFTARCQPALRAGLGGLNALA